MLCLSETRQGLPVNLMGNGQSSSDYSYLLDLIAS
jgi:hypothetical protein